jgi:hypothetical protein
MVARPVAAIGEVRKYELKRICYDYCAWNEREKNIKNYVVLFGA